MQPEFAKTLDQRLDEMGRGSRSALADACAVRPASVTGWLRQGNLPTPEKWTIIEQFCSWPSGRVADLVGEVSAAEVQRLRLQVEELTARLDRIESP
jgi:hypothetical protein